MIYEKIKSFINLNENTKVFNCPICEIENSCYHSHDNINFYFGVCFWILDDDRKLKICIQPKELKALFINDSVEIEIDIDWFFEPGLTEEKIIDKLKLYNVLI